MPVEVANLANDQAVRVVGYKLITPSEGKVRRGRNFVQVIIKT